METNQVILSMEKMYNQEMDQTTYGDRKTDLNRDGLVGPIYSVRTNRSIFSSNFAGSTEGQREFVSLETYSFDGKLATYSSNDRGSREFLTDRSYFNHAGEDGTEAMLFRYRDRLNHRLDWSIITDMSIICDEEGNIGEAFFYTDDGSIAWLFLYQYDIEGRRIREDVCEADGTPISLYVCDYNEAGYPATEAVFKGDGSLASLSVHTSYEADPSGNWIKRVSEVIDKADNSHIREIIWRAITYHFTF